MKYLRFTAPARGFFMHALHAHRAMAFFGSIFVLIGVIGAVATSTASAAAADQTTVCQPATGYGLPLTLSLTSASDGVTVQDDGVTPYGVGGDSVSAVRTALNSCAPSFMGGNQSGEFLAYTSYAIDWQYAEAPQTDGLCSLTNVKVGLHLSQLLPSLSTTAATPHAVTDKWAGFHKGLQAHEDGHKAINIAAAQDMLAMLHSLHEPCATISSHASAMTTNALKDLVAANADHDTTTDYGRDQGASW